MSINHRQDDAPQDAPREFSSRPSSKRQPNKLDAEEFLAVVMPAVKQGDPAKLAQAISVRWTARDVGLFLKQDNVQVRRVAAVALGFVGKAASVPSLVRALKDADHQVNQMAEHSLWSIWFRGGNETAKRSFKMGVQMLEQEDYPKAITHLEEAFRQDPTFTESLNQCAIAHFFNGNYEQAVATCIQVIERMPTHFGAVACLGHCHMQLGNFEKALECYLKALRINPCMPAISQSIDRLEQAIARQNDSSGYFQMQDIG